jgi:MFS family permease
MARQRKLHYAWIVAGVTFLTLLVAAGLRATPGVLIVPLETEFGWSRATISFAIGLNIFLYGLIGPFAAAMMDRFGLRRTPARRDGRAEHQGVASLPATPTGRSAARVGSSAASTRHRTQCGRALRASLSGLLCLIASLMVLFIGRRRNAPSLVPVPAE